MTAPDPAAPVERRLLPITAAVAADGRLSVGGCDVGGLARRYGTPLFVYDEEHLRARCRAYREAFDGQVIYAGKAFLCKAMARLVAEEELFLDVATGGELSLALAAGFPGHRMVLHGNNKSDAEIGDAIAAGVGRIVVDSSDELDRLLARVCGTPALWLRVNPDVEAHTHEYIETGTEGSKFGFPRALAAEAAQRISATDGRLFLAGLHCHIGSQIHALGSYVRAAEVMAGIAAEVTAVTGHPLADLGIGGGLGVAYTADEASPGLDEFAGAVRAAVEEAWRHQGMRPPTVFVEPGRSIVAAAGMTVYEVGTIKVVPGVRTFVAVDGGMSDNLRPALYGARYEAFCPTRADAPRPFVATIVGKHCESGDVVVRDAQLPSGLAVGDLLCTPVTGAYGYAMASNYNKVPRPAVVFVNRGEPRVVIRRETIADLCRLDAD